MENDGDNPSGQWDTQGRVTEDSRWLQALIAGIDALTDNFDPVTGRRLIDAAGTLQWLTLTGGMQDIKQEHRRQIRDWIRAADQDEDGDEEDEEADWA